MDASNGDKPKARWRVPRFHLISLLMGVLAAGWWLGMNLNRRYASIDATEGLVPVYVYGFPVDAYGFPSDLFSVLDYHYGAVLVDLALGLAFAVYVMVTIERSLKRTSGQPRGWRGPFRMPAVACGWLLALLLLTANGLGQPSGVRTSRHIAKWLAQAEGPRDLNGALSEYQFPDYRTYGWPFPAMKFRAFEINHGRLEAVEILPLLADSGLAFVILLACMHFVERLTGAKSRASPESS